MTTYSTGNSIGSADPRDLYDNAQVIDRFANSEEFTAEDRLGQVRKTIAGLNDSVEQAITSAGYEFVGDYAAGIELTAYNQVVRDANGEFWRVSGATGLPYTATGAGLPEGGALVTVGDAALRQELAAGVSAGQGGLLVGNAVIYADSLTDLQSIGASMLSDGQLAAVGSSTWLWAEPSASWRARGRVDASAFGITPGSGDDITSKLQDLIDYTASRKLVAYFPEGEYLLAGQVTIDQSYTAIVGDGMGRTVFLNDSGNANLHAIKLSPSTSGISDILISGLSIRGTATSGSALVDDTSNPVARLTLSAVEINTPNRSNVFFGDTTSGGLSEFAIRGCVFESSGVQAYNVAFRKKCEGLVVEGCKFTLSDSGSFNNLAVYADTTSFIIRSNHFYGGGHSPIACSPANNGIISDNIVKNALFTQISEEGGIELEWKDTHQGIDTTHDVVVSGNVVKGYHWGIVATRRDELGANPGAPYNITIYGNIVLDCDNHSIRLEECDDVKVVDNHVSGGSSSITIGAVRGALISGNTLELVGNGFTAINKATFTASKGMHIKILNNHIRFDGTRKGINFDSDGSVQHEFIEVCGNTFEALDLTCQPVVFKNSRRLNINENTFVLGDVSIDIDCGASGRSISVKGNSCSEIDGTAILVTSAGENLTITANDIRGAGDYGVDIGVVASGASVTANTIHDATLSGIRVRAGASDYGRVGENAVILTGGYGINIESDNWLVAGNVVAQTSLAAINDSGVGNLLANNKTP